MASVNKAILIGNLVKDPETRYMSNGEAVTNITVATSETWKDANGQKQEKSEFHRVTFYRKLAEIAGEYLKKGRPVYIEGRLETKKWMDKNGVERYTTDIIAREMQMLGIRPNSSESAPDHVDDNPAPSRSAPSRNTGGFDDMDDDLIPFN